MTFISSLNLQLSARAVIDTLTFTFSSRVIRPRHHTAWFPWELVVECTALITLHAASVSLTLACTQASRLVERTMISICMSITVAQSSNSNFTHSIMMLRDQETERKNNDRKQEISWHYFEAVMLCSLMHVS